jgi:Alcohol dehydrogenase transcription factor Myb/SANT-like
MKRWAECDTVKFVKLYRDYECLWNTTKNNYKNHKMRQAALRRIVTEMTTIENFTIADARMKIKNLRSTYSQELSKIDKSIKSGMAPEDVYVPSMKWFKIMDQFLRKSKDKRGNTQSNVVSSLSLSLSCHKPYNYDFIGNSIK